MSVWTADRIPIVVPPLPGESLESWIGAYARRLRSTSRDLLDHIGLRGARIGQLAVRLTDVETALLVKRTGLSAPVVTAMTLQPYDDLAISILPGRRRLGRAPAWRFSGARARFCPACLGQADGRGPVIWRLPWSFACPAHHLLLLDYCPSCGQPPRPWNVTRLGPAAPGSCTRNFPRQHTDQRWVPCHSDLTRAPTVSLPPAGLVLNAHRRLAELLNCDVDDRPQASAQLRKLYALAARALRGIHSVADQAPPIVAEVIDECGGTLPTLDDNDVGPDAHNAAIGTALAIIALDTDTDINTAHPDHEALFEWIVRADRAMTGVEGRKRKNIGMLAGRWAWAGPELVSRVLTKVDPLGNLHSRLRYASATPKPRWPDLSAETITRRAAMIPAMLWPGWTMRLLPLPAGGHPKDRHNAVPVTAFRRGCATFLLLPGGPPQLNYQRAGPLLGNHQIDTDRGSVEQRFYKHQDLTPLAATLAQLASALDEHGSPINYARRRTLFTPSTVTIDLDAYTRLCLQHGLKPRQSRLTTVMLWYLLILLTGEQHDMPGWPKSQHMQAMRFRIHATQPLRAFLHQQARLNLLRHGIDDEPVTWEPPRDWAGAPRWPGIGPGCIDPERVRHALNSTVVPPEAAHALGISTEHLRLYCELTGISATAKPANGIPLAPERAALLSPERLRDLYQHQQLDISAIAQMASCAKNTIRRLLQHDGIPLRRPPDISRAWLETEYHHKRRDLQTLARERHINPGALAALATSWGIPVRGHGHDALTHLALSPPPSPAIRAVATGHQGLHRLKTIVGIAGHDNIASAARAIYDGRESALRQRLTKIEHLAGFKIFHRRTTPITPTERGREFLAEATKILQAQKQAERAVIPPDRDQLHTRERKRSSPTKRQP